MAYHDLHYPTTQRSREEHAQLKQRYEDFDTSVIKTIFKDDMNLDVEKVTATAGWGTGHVIYFVDTKERGQLVFRANINYKWVEEMMLIEQEISERLVDLNVPIGKVLIADISRSKYQFDYQIQELLPGKDLELDWQGNKADYDAISFQLGQAIATYQDVTFEGFGRLVKDGEKTIGKQKSFYDFMMLHVDEELESLLKSDVISRNQVGSIKRYLEDGKGLMDSSPHSLVHYDLADHNLRYSGNKLAAIFDWENAVSGDPVLDLASCPTWKTHYERTEKLIEGYKSVRELPDNFDEKMKLYILRTRLWKMEYAAVHRPDLMNEDRINGFKKVLAELNL